MQINIPNLVNTALPEHDTRGRNAIILSQNSGPNHNEQGFLSRAFPRSARKLFVTAEGDGFDEATLSAWRAEGFDVRYVGLGDDDNDATYRARLAGLRDEAGLGPCETFGIVAFGDAAALCLEFFHHADHNPDFKLACLVAYYPPRVPDVRAIFPGGLRVLVHLIVGDGTGGGGGGSGGASVGVVAHSQIAGFQGKKRTVRRAVGRGVGVGRSGVAVGGTACAYPCYGYEAPSGFAEHDLDEYDPVAAGLAWSRSLDAVQKAFRMDVELEGIVESNLEGKFFTRNLDQTVATYTTHETPHATYFPTLSGGIGVGELRRFYAEYFLSANPESTRLTLVSRTAAADRVVDELHVGFRHTQEMPWILPGVPPTGRRVEVAVVSVVALRGGRLRHEHVYWDQASVLVQVGLLDPKLVPDKARRTGVTRLPVVGREAARRLLRGFEDGEDEDGEADNELLPGWYDDEEEEAEKEEKKKGKGKGKEKEKKKGKERDRETKNDDVGDGAKKQKSKIKQEKGINGEEPVEQNGKEPDAPQDVSDGEEQQKPHQPTQTDGTDEDGNDDDGEREQGEGPEDKTGVAAEEAS